MILPVLYELQPFSFDLLLFKSLFGSRGKTKESNTWVRVLSSELLKEWLCFYYLGVRETLRKWVLKFSLTNSEPRYCLLLQQVEFMLLSLIYVHFQLYISRAFGSFVYRNIEDKAVWAKLPFKSENHYFSQTFNFYCVLKSPVMGIL